MSSPNHAPMQTAKEALFTPSAETVEVDHDVAAGPASLDQAVPKRARLLHLNPAPSGGPVVGQHARRFPLGGPAYGFAMTCGAVVRRVKRSLFRHVEMFNAAARVPDKIRRILVCEEFLRCLALIA